VLTDLIQIRRLGEKKRPENERLRKHLKTYRFVERRLVKIAQDIESGIDCTECANCCRTATVRLKDRDIEKLAKHLSVKPHVFVRDYTEETEDEGLILKRGEGGCPFLEGNLCGVYDARPTTCQDFPHLVHGPGSLVSRMWAMTDRASFCPIVYNTLEAWKPEVGFTATKES
jgi:Fe-S-cluster containining protein